jgi:hypothetical protein
MVQIIPLKDAGDVRGASFSVGEQVLGCLSAVRDAHRATILPGCVRGNHFHRLRRELLVVYYQDRWTFGWDEGESTGVQEAHFEGSGVVAIEVLPMASHAIRNDGTDSLVMLGLGDLPYDRLHPDAHRRVVLSAKG